MATRYKAKFGSTYLGSECLLWTSQTQRLVGGERPQLWQNAAVLDDDTVGRIWRIAVQGRYEAATREALMSWFEALVSTLQGLGQSTLTIEEYTGGSPVHTYTSARFDTADNPAPAPGAGWFTYDVTWHFTAV